MLCWLVTTSAPSWLAGRAVTATVALSGEPLLTLDLPTDAGAG